MSEILNNTKILAKYYGGSILYGLDTPESDLDIRGVFVYNDPLILVGYVDEKPLVVQDDNNDINMKGFNDFIRLLAKGNTEAMECLYADHSQFLELDPVFEEFVLKQPEKFLNSEKIFKCFRGYIQGERRLANGERTGQLGGKRREKLNRYGFSPRNFSHLLRLTFCGKFFFQHRQYPVHLASYDQNIHNLCFSIKTEPEKFTKEQLNNFVDIAEQEFVETYEKRTFDLVPDVDYIHEVVCLMNREAAKQIISTSEKYGI